MAIKLQNISKVYGKQYALKNVSVTINRGEVVGLLGPNGAGKSTLMKILTGYLTASEGNASIDDLEIDNQKIKSIIGYLPENNPLYLDMYVREYLRFIANLYKIKHAKEEINRIVQWCGLIPEQNKKIGALSKGYKQRLGLAQALIHRPEILILDEPTSGLDPNQLVEIRKLIKEVGKEKTVLLSSHILQEVEAICNRVIILNKGEIVADEKTADLSKLVNQGEQIELELDKSIAKEDFNHLNGILKAQAIGENKWLIHATIESDIRQQLFELSVRKGIKIRAMQKVESSLVQVFQELTVR
ncbi:MAG: ATP-binding cassette domain-containing protein [Bacteroidales bacterium]|nr:ATP-binding cassette domain-containing protein [Bacteroidales bacterium]